MHPRLALLPNGTFLYRNNVPHAFPTSAGPWAHCVFTDDGAEYTAGPRAPVVGPPIPTDLQSIPLYLVVNSTVQLFQVDTSITKATVLRAGNCELHVTPFPGALRCQIRNRIKTTDAIDYGAVRLGCKGAGSEYNLDRSGKWNGRVSGMYRGQRVLHVLVENAKEQFPRGYAFDGVNLDLIWHTNILPRDTSKAGVTDLRAYCTGTLQTKLIPEYVEFLKSDPEISQAAKEIPVDQQATGNGEFSVGMTFWLSFEPVEPLAPLNLLGPYESWPFSTIKPGVSDHELRAVESRLLQLSEGWLAEGPRGSILYGDFPEQPNSFYRVRGCQFHYFSVTDNWHAFLQYGNPRRYKLAKAFGAATRNNYWLDGQCGIYKRLLPWGGPYTANGHWADSEALLLAWLCDGDYLSLMEYQRWEKAFTIPNGVDREATVACRMMRVNHWFTGNPASKAAADGIEARVIAAVEAVKKTTQYQQFGTGLPEGILFAPTWTKKNLKLGKANVEGALNVNELADTQQLESAAGLVVFGQWPLGGCRIGPGLLGESYVGLHRERIADYFRGRKLQAKHRTIYGTPADKIVRVVIEKSDDAASTLRIALGQRHGGDIPDVLVTLVTPDGTRTVLSSGWPKYPIPVAEQGHIDGWPVVGIRLPFVGKAGRYVLEVKGDKLMLHAPVADPYVEWQATDCDFEFAGQNSEGFFPVGNVLVGSG